MAEKPSPSTRRKINRSIQAAVTLMMIAAVVTVVWEIFQDPQLQTFWRHIHNGTTADFTKAWKDQGDLLNQIAPVGNVAVLYRGFNPANPDDVAFAAESYFLGGLEIYPRRIFTADETKIINKGQDVINPNFLPSVEWLQQNGVQVVATYTMAGPNQFQLSTQRVRPVAPLQGGR
jgi:hypothetical protein